MRIEDVVALAKAGFNVNQISEMNKQMMSQQMPVQQMPVQQMPVQGDAYMQKLNEILSGVQMSAINNSQIMNPPETADDILAHIINPKEQEVK